MIRRAAPGRHRADIVRHTRDHAGAGRAGRCALPRRDLPDRGSGRRAHAVMMLRGKAMGFGMTLASTGLLLAALAPSGTATPSPGTVGLGTATPSSGTVTPSPGTATPSSGGGSGAAPGEEPRTRAVTATAAHLTFDLERVVPVVEPRALVSPVEDPVLASSFGYRVDPVDGVGVELHTGLDYAAPCGTPVTAARRGTVVDSGWHAYGGGLRIVVDHGDGLETTYNHLGSLEIGAGTAVDSGDLLGLIGSTGNSTGCHLHFEVIVEDVKVDPLLWL